MTVKRLFPVLLFVLMLATGIGTAAAQSNAPGEADWYARYWNNRDLAGATVLERGEKLINYDWGAGAPAGGVNADNFSARWTATVYFSPGTYRFTTVSDDGVRLYVKDGWVINNWTNHTSTTNTATVSLSGNTSLIVEYYEAGGGALLKVWWERIDGGTTSWSEANWYARYWNNIEQKGDAVFGRNEKMINYDWGTGAPAPGVNADNFSVRWTAFVKFDAGTYRFTTVSDDGVGLYVADHHIISSWGPHGRQTDTGTITLAAGTYAVALDYYDKGGGAVAKLWWERISTASPAPTPAPDTGATATTTVYLRMRSGPSTSYTILQVVPTGKQVSLLGKTADGKWLYASYLGKSGWMSATYLVPNVSLANVPVVQG